MNMHIVALFDIDNTLIQSSAGHRQAYREAVEDVYGLKVDMNVINYHGMTDQEIIFKVLRKYKLDKGTIRSDLKKCMEVMALKYAEIVKSENINILAGVGELLTKLQQNDIICGLVTGNLEKIARAKLKKIGLDHHFKIGGFGSDHMDRAELAKLAIRRAESRFDLGRDRSIFLFGDAPQDMRAGKAVIFLFGDAPQDMRAGKAVGATSIGVTTGVFSREQLESAGADIVFQSLTDIDHIFKLILIR
jgi:phosphoglycolate phosphatase-like HAD superfamily hydrolase